MGAADGPNGSWQWSSGVGKILFWKVFKWTEAEKTEAGGVGVYLQILEWKNEWGLVVATGARSSGNGKLVDMAELLFTEVFNALQHIAIKIIGTISVKVTESRCHIGDLKELLQMEKVEFKHKIHEKTRSWIRFEVTELLKKEKASILRGH
ncbi:hypothetical protein C5167_010286 [Papaver somniferum]|uniref:Uncharacterized protein n=1 Tax=Papaver somniferum TaxID=3469 RepID=A0A4Y7K2M8_PAPSO|nr:hypothetical protein C5167_010286 [Papaver somniferum]